MDVCVERFCFVADVALVLIVFAQKPEVLHVEDWNAVLFTPLVFYH